MAHFAFIINSYFIHNMVNNFMDTKWNYDYLVDFDDLKIINFKKNYLFNKVMDNGVFN
jgi:hypothetical protein